uniref:Uncharacterized protein LOC111136813 n=1 Tax=Crassostrea virginica TaxID=6565 RepID=A0A8B8EVF9_CRAVI|nr:uncharacterized protein LOC111136813 [Crassostrea virginica]
MACAQGNPRGTTDFDGDKLQKELEENGYAVIPDLMTASECDTLTSEFKDWVDKFHDGHIPLQKRTSVIQSYRVGHFQPSWEVRLKAKAVFKAVWGTDKLLSSIDGIAISKPPENADEYRKESKDWLHLDKGCGEKGTCIPRRRLSRGTDKGGLLLPSIGQVPPLPRGIFQNVP